MRKRLIETSTNYVEHDTSEWLDLERLAVAEVTSEEAGYPLESALGPGDGPGWRAAVPGEQLIRFVFDEPQRIRRIRVVFEEPSETRTQEFVLRWSSTDSDASREIVRQRWNFHPHEATREVEIYRTELESVGVLELSIIPDVQGGHALSTLRSFRVC